MVIHWKRQYQKGFLKYSLANILGAAICYGIVLILLLFRLGEICGPSSYYWSLALDVLGIRNHYDKLQLNCAWDRKNKLCRQP